MESEKNKPQIFLYTFFLHVQCCVRVSASNFQVLTRKSGGARAFRKHCPFFAGPVRTCEKVKVLLLSYNVILVTVKS